MNEYEILFGACDESLHPRCEGVECETVCSVGGFASLSAATAYAVDVLDEEDSRDDLAGEPTYSEMGGHPDSILRDYNVFEVTDPAAHQADTGAGRTLVHGAHDDWGLFN